MMKVTIDLAPDEIDTLSQALQRSIEVQDRAANRKSTSGYFTILLDTLSILEGLKRGIEGGKS